MDVQQIVALIFGFLSGATGLRLITGFWHLVTGRSRRKRDEVDRLQDRVDCERDYARRLGESLADHRQRMLSSPCFTPADLPEFPARPSRPFTGPNRTIDKEN